MTAVIEFPVGRIRPATGSAGGEAAEVIIFPGVRVERLIYDLAERLPPLRGGSAAQARAGDLDFY